jgi:hypothetical protein
MCKGNAAAMVYPQVDWSTAGGLLLLKETIRGSLLGKLADPYGEVGVAPHGWAMLTNG